MQKKNFKKKSQKIIAIIIKQIKKSMDVLKILFLILI